MIFYSLKPGISKASHDFSQSQAHHGAAGDVKLCYNAILIYR